MTIRQETYELLTRAQALLGHAVDPRDLPELLHRALEELVSRLEQRRFAATARPREPRRPASTRMRHIPAHVRRAVWQRDQGQCTFVSDSGRRCCSKTRLELDHIEPVARGGASTESNLRLRCRAHNQLAAEQAFGAGFMEQKRATARQRSEQQGSHRGLVSDESGPRAAAIAELVPWLRALGLRRDEAQRAAAHCESIADAPLEERVRHALA